MWTLENLIESCDSVKVLLDDKWVPARPLRAGGLWLRLASAWAVLTGKAEAFTWPGGQ